jgi:hypothetical protein
MRLLAYVMVLSNFYGGIEDVFDILESYRISEDEKSSRVMKSNFPRTSPIPYSDLDRSYLLRTHQDRHCYNRQTQLSQRALEVRTKSNRIKSAKQNLKIREEQKIKTAFHRKDKNKTWAKRHQYSGYYKTK